MRYFYLVMITMLLISCNTSGIIYVRLDSSNLFTLREGAHIYANGNIVGKFEKLIVDEGWTYIKCRIQNLKTIKTNEISINSSSMDHGIAYIYGIELGKNIEEINYGDTISGIIQNQPLDSAYYEGVNLINQELKKLKSPNSD